MFQDFASLSSLVKVSERSVSAYHRGYSHKRLTLMLAFQDRRASPYVNQKLERDSESPW